MKTIKMIVDVPIDVYAMWMARGLKLGTLLNEVLDEIKAEILEEKEYAYADFEQYKVDYLGQDEEDVLDSLPQDDFRYGMERAIEIIDKYRKEQE